MSSSKPAFTILLSIVLLLASSRDFACADNLFTYTVPTAEHAGRFSGELPIDRIGNMILPKGLASFLGDELLIRAVPQWLFDRNVVLKGVIVRAEGAQQANGFLLAGLVLMLDGLWLNNLSKASATESIDTMDGATWQGRIIGRIGTGDALTFQHSDGKTESIAFSKIKSINSGRAFTFNISTDHVKISPADNSLSFDGKQLLMKSRKARHAFWAYDHVPRSNLAGTEAGISNKALATFVGLDIISTIAPPIAIPLVLNARNQRAAKNRIAEAEFQSFTQSSQSFAHSSSSANSSSASSSTGM